MASPYSILSMKNLMHSTAQTTFSTIGWILFTYSTLAITSGPMQQSRDAHRMLLRKQVGVTE